MKKYIYIYREDLNGHISQKINQFALLHLPESTPSK